LREDLPEGAATGRIITKGLIEARIPNDSVNPAGLTSPDSDEREKYDCSGAAARKDKLSELKMATRETRTPNQKSAMIAIVENLPCGIRIGGCATGGIRAEGLAEAANPPREPGSQMGAKAGGRNKLKETEENGRKQEGKQKSRCAGRAQWIRDGKIDR
jgi:hypothetical protein